MAMLETILLVLQIVVAIALCGLILLHHGKGAEMGASFGGGSAGSLFGATGSANFLSRTTAIVATVFGGIDFAPFIAMLSIEDA